MSVNRSNHEHASQNHGVVDPEPDGGLIGPDYTSAYDGLSDAGFQSVYDEGYVAPTPEPVVGGDHLVPPGPAPLQPYAQQQAGYGYGYQQAPAPYANRPVAAPFPAQPYPFSFQAVALPEHPLTGAIFGLGVAGLATWITAPIAWYLGAKAKREIAKGAPYRFSSLASLGYVLGVVGSILLALFVLLMCLVLISGA